MDRQTLRRWRRLEYNITGLRLPCLACGMTHAKRHKQAQNYERPFSPLAFYHSITSLIILK